MPLNLPAPPPRLVGLSEDANAPALAAPLLRQHFDYRLAASLFTDGGVLNLASYRVGRPDDTSAFLALLADWRGETVLIPSGAFTIGDVAISVPAGQTMRILGAGSSATTLICTGVNGIAAALGLSAGLHVSGLRLQRGPVAGQAYAGTGLSLVGSFVQGAQGAVSVADLVFADTTTAWATGLYLESVTNGNFRAIRGHSPGATTPDPAYGGTLIRLHGRDASNYAIDNDFAGISAQGGYAGLRVTGYVQGVYLDNFRFIGSSFGIDWATPQGTYGELLTATNGHCNAYRAGIRMSLGSQSMLSNILFLRYAPDAGEWCAVDMPECNNIALSGLNVYGAGQGVEYGVRYVCQGAAGGQPSAITGCSIANIVGGAAIRLGGTVAATSVTGNSMSGVTAGVVSDLPTNLVRGNLVNGDESDYTGSIVPKGLSRQLGSGLAPWASVFTGAVSVGPSGSATRGLVTGDTAGNLMLSGTTVQMGGPMQVKGLVFAALPAATLYPGVTYRITDRNQRFVTSDAGTWRFMDGTAAS